ncbi:hypothetical protein Alches_25990 [Alicyclobacillus hesperidum subsp. aegles]|uniref:hypothetical protein n=1 Tax=Alicyclobacillus hesperidum TaxID=89784 RepID=UPI00222DA32B|nr:hypothetical protein [Alicyclobacillus hesperidum]GLG02558.1 hypothetical protein Alches_25990 [Alicyclobacillus hesperidum subsp. aegles]
MRISNISFRLTKEDLNEMIAELAPDVRLRIVDIKSDGVHGQFRFLMWNIDFCARPYCNREKGEIAVEITARKLVNIPPALVQMSLQEAIKDAPSGIEVLRQSLKLNVPSILEPLQISLNVEDFSCVDGSLVIRVSDCDLALLKGKLPSLGRHTQPSGR